MDSARLLSIFADSSSERRTFAANHPVRYFIGEFLRPAALMAFLLTIADTTSVNILRESGERLRFLVVFGILIATANFVMTRRLIKQLRAN